MKITFGKRASQGNSIKRCITSGRNLKSFNFGKDKKRQSMIYWAVLIFLLILFFSHLIIVQLRLNKYDWKFYLFYPLATPVLLTIHELLHVLPCKILGLKNIVLSFYPNGVFLNPFARKASACVNYDTFPLTLSKQIFITIMPFIVLSVIPAIAAIFIPDIRYDLIYFSLFNAFICTLDIPFIITLLIEKPKGRFFTTGDVIMIPQGDDSTIAAIYVKSDDKIIVDEWKVSGKKLIEIEPDISGKVEQCVKEIEKELAEGAWWVSKAV